MNKEFIKIATVTPTCYLGNPIKNANNMIDIMNNTDADILLYPELALTGYTLGDFVFNQELKKEHNIALDLMINATNEKLIIFGGLLFVDKKILNVAYVVQNKKILGITPKFNFANGHEFNDYRYFNEIINPVTVKLNNQEIIVGKTLYNYQDICFGVEVCHDLWVENAPNIEYYSNGADIIFNPSASSFAVDKELFRTLLCNEASSRGGAYVYTSNGPSETSSDLVFSGHQIVSVFGETILDNETMSFDNAINITSINLKDLKNYQKSSHKKEVKLEKNNLKYPFRVNSDEAKQIADVTKAALYKRLNHIGIKDVVLGISGGLDSTLALLFAYDCYMTYGLDPKNIHGITMPGLATQGKTKSIATRLMEKLGITSLEKPIKVEVEHHLALIGHDGVTKDVTYENAQARYRTYVLMNYANLCKGIVLGTSDMSEIALGWSTFAGDQIAMYALNSGLPKTCIQSMVNYYANKYPFIKKELEEVLNLPITPELTGDDQLTENLIGSYAVNDFIMYQYIHLGLENQVILDKLVSMFNLSVEEANVYLNRFIKRFKQNQFKRIATCEGIKIFDFSLSPREYRFPGDMK